MTHEILCTSASQGLQPGSHGFCTVVATNATPMSLAEELKSLGGYRHAFPPDSSEGYLNPVNYSHAIVRVDRQQYNVLSRISDAGLDDAGHPNRLAHHVALEKSQLVDGGPAWVLQSNGFCETSWHGETKMLDAGRQPPTDERPPGFCLEWEKLTGDAGWAGILAETALAEEKRPTCIIFEPGMNMLPLVVESLALIPKEKRWEVTFSTYVANLRAEVDYQWRFLLKGSPEATSARMNPHVSLIDLTKELGTADGGELVETARQGPVPKPTRPERPKSERVTKTESTAMDESNPQKKPIVPMPPMDEPMELSDIAPVELSDVSDANDPAEESVPLDPFAGETAAPEKPVRKKRSKSPSARSIPPAATTKPKQIAGRFPDEVPTPKDQSTGSKKILIGAAIGILLLVSVGVAALLSGSGDADSDTNEDSLIASNEDTEADTKENTTEATTNETSEESTSEATTSNETQIVASTTESPSTKMKSEKTPAVTADTKKTEPLDTPENTTTKKTPTVVAKVDTPKPATPTTKTTTKTSTKTTPTATDKKADKTKKKETPDPPAKTDNPGTTPQPPVDKGSAPTYLTAAQLGEFQFYTSEELKTPPRKIIEQDERVLTLPTFHTDVWLSDSMQLRILGGSLVEFMVPYEQGSGRPPVIRILYGRTEITSADSSSSQIYIRAGEKGGENGTITFEGSGDTREVDDTSSQKTIRVAIEVTADVNDPTLSRLFLYSEKADAISWDGKGTLTETAPAWFQAESDNPQVEQTDASVKLVEILAKDKELPDLDPRSEEYRDKLIELLRKQAVDSNDEDQSLAAISLGALDDFDHLAKLLSSIDKSKAKKLRYNWEEYVSTLHQAALRSPLNANKVYQALSTRHVYSQSGNELETLRKMVTGYSQAELEKAVAAKPLDEEKAPIKTLFACLQSQKIILRTFAAWNLRGFSKSYFSYKPYDDPTDKTSQRALDRWRKELKLDQ